MKGEKSKNMKIKDLKRQIQRQNVKKQTKGITLIALVITIIVLLILAAVSIATLTGENGILTRANDSTKQTEIASVKEQAQLDIANWIAERLENGEDTTLDDATVKNIIETENASNSNKYYKELQSDKIITPSGYEILYSELYTETEVGNDNIKEYTEDGVPIPKGFFYVGGTKDTGVIISDNPADANKGTSHEVAQNVLQGNQFVWVPVEEEYFERFTGYYNGEYDEGAINACAEPYVTAEYTTEKEEYDSMKASVTKYSGFYVGRYEAGVEGTRTSGIADAVVIKQGKNVYNYIGWSNSDDMTVQTGGAVQKSKEFEGEKGYSSVTSTLIYGVQWDAIMQWIDPAYRTGSCESNSFVRDSSGKGWYGQSAPTTTGSNASYAVKNMYDLGGNVAEWTMEAGGTSDRVFRGGGYSSSGLEYPASSRYVGYPSLSHAYYGFRLVLYLK